MINIKLVIHKVRAIKRVLRVSSEIIGDSVIGVPKGEYMYVKTYTITKGIVRVIVDHELRSVSIIIIEITNIMRTAGEASS